MPVYIDSVEEAFGGWWPYPVANDDIEQYRKLPDSYRQANHWKGIPCPVPESSSSRSATLPTIT